MKTIYEMLSEARICASTEVPKREFLFTWNGTPCFPRGELVALTGKAKSGKTYVCSILMSLMFRNRILCFSRKNEAGTTSPTGQAGTASPASLTSPTSLTSPAGRAGTAGLTSHTEPAADAFQCRVLWIDTEQSEDSTHEILTTRIGTLCGGVPDDTELIAYNLRRYNWEDRLSLVTDSIALHKPELVVFDGIRDVVGDINDYNAAQTVISRMLSVASWSNACIVCVLHQNKAIEDRTLRGALGTELQNKAFETYECRKDSDTRIFTLTQTATRKYDISSRLNFTVTSDGLPTDTFTPEPDNTSATTSGTTTAPAGMPPTRADAVEAMKQILANGRQRTWLQLRSELMSRCGIKSQLYAEQCIRFAHSNNYISRTAKENGIALYMLAPASETTLFSG